MDTDEHLFEIHRALDELDATLEVGFKTLAAAILYAANGGWRPQSLADCEAVAEQLYGSMMEASLGVSAETNDDTKDDE